MTDCTSMFEGCTSLVSIDLENFSDCEIATRMFYGCSALRTVENMEDMNNLETVDYMFYNCTLLENIDMPTSAPLDDVSYMMYDCRNITALNMSSFGSITKGNHFIDSSRNNVLTVNNMPDISYLETGYYPTERDGTGFFGIPGSNPSTLRLICRCDSEETALNMAKWLKSNGPWYSKHYHQTIGPWGAQCHTPVPTTTTAPSSLSMQDGVISIDESQIEDMFVYDLTNNDILDLQSTTKQSPAKFNIKNITSTTFGSQISGESVSYGYYLNDSDTNPTYTATDSLNGNSIYADYSETTLPSSVGINFYGDTHIVKSPDLSNLTSNSSTSLTMTFEGCSALQEIPNLSPRLINLTQTFRNCTSLTTATIRGTNISNTFAAFEGCTSLRTVTGISGTITNAEEMFKGCTALEEIHDWNIDTSNCTMTNCFANCTSLQNVFIKKPTVDLTDWKLIKIASTTTGADVTVYKTTLTTDQQNEDALDTIRTKNITYRGDKKLTSLLYTEEFLGLKQVVSIPDATLISLLKYRYPFADIGLDPSKRNFVLWASDKQAIQTNISFSDIVHDITNIFRVYGEGESAATAVLVANAQSSVDSQTNTPGRTVRVKGDLQVVDGDITGDLTGDVTGNVTGNAGTATKLETARSINGTSFDGSADITTSKWGTARNIYISDSDGTNTGSAVSVNGSGNATLKLPSTIKATLSGNADTATKATQDESGNNIKDKYGSTLSLSGTSLKLLDANGNANSSLTLAKSNVGLGSVDNTADLAKTVLKAASLGVYTCSDSAAATTKAIAVSNFVLYTGARLYIIFSNANTASSPKLKVGSSVEKPIKLGSSSSSTTSDPTWANPASGSTASSAWNGIKANVIYEAYYDGTNWILSAMNGPSMGVKGYYFSTSKSYIKFTNGLIIQWGIATTSNYSGSISFPVNYTSASSYTITLTASDSGTSVAYRIAANRNSGSSTSIYTTISNSNFNWMWIAIGY